MSPKASNYNNIRVRMTIRGFKCHLKPLHFAKVNKASQKHNLEE